MTGFNFLKRFNTVLTEEGSVNFPVANLPVASGLGHPGYAKRHATVVKAIEPFKVGRVRFQGSWWSARCNRGMAVAAGERVKVVGRENITLLVEPVTQPLGVGQRTSS